MSSRQYTISADDITTNSATVVITTTAAYSTSENVEITVTSATGTVAFYNVVEIPADTPSGTDIDTPITGLRSNMEYTITDDYTNVVTFTTLINDNPKVASITQWENLADRVNGKATIGETLSTPPSAAYVGTNNIVDGAVTTSKLADASVTSAKIDFTTLSGNYSETEVDTGFTWIDGKHIYKKTIDIGALPNSTSKDVLHNISNLGYVVEIKGTAYEQATTNSITLPYVGDSANTGVKMYVNSTKINIWAGTSRSTYSGYVTLYYTKSS